jgi:molybdopterin converting factor subunit 1
VNSVRTFFFATLRDRLGMRLVEIQIPADTNVAGFKRILVEKFPLLNGLVSSALVAVNQEYAYDDAVIPADAEIALFPPVSGG